MELLKKDGFTHISEAVGADLKKREIQKWNDYASKEIQTGMKILNISFLPIGEALVIGIYKDFTSLKRRFSGEIFFLYYINYRSFNGKYFTQILYKNIK
jgi:hypothetical protein